MAESIVAYSGKSLKTMAEEGGSGHWTASPERVSQCKYIVVVRNMREHLANRDVPHGTAFLIAEINGVKASVHAARSVVTFNRYALINVENAWQTATNGQRFPLAYHETEFLLRVLGIDLNALVWHTLHEEESPNVPIQTIARLPSDPVAIVQKAKQELANLLNIKASQIEIKLTF